MSDKTRSVLMVAGIAGMILILRAYAIHLGLW